MEQKASHFHRQHREPFGITWYLVTPPKPLGFLVLLSAGPLASEILRKLHQQHIKFVASLSDKINDWSREQQQVQVIGSGQQRETLLEKLR